MSGLSIRNEILIDYVKINDAEQVRKSLMKGSNPNLEIVKYSETISLLQAAIEYHNYDMAEALLKAAADPDKGYSTRLFNENNSPIVYCSSGNGVPNPAKFIRLLHHYGADINQIETGKLKYTPLCRAINEHNFELVSLFLELGAELKVGTSSYGDAVTLAKESGSKEIMAMVERAQLNRLVRADIADHNSIPAASPPVRARI